MAFIKTVGFAAALALAAGPALAVTVSNQSDKTQTVTVDLGNEEPKTEIAPGKSATLDCPEGCELRATSTSYGLPAQKGDKVVIGKDGILAYEGSSREASNETKKAN